MGKWKVPDVAPRGPNNCVEHAISVMRLTLGYKTGLPKGKWHEWTEDTRRLEGWSLKAFPRHAGMYICTEDQDIFRDPFWESFLLGFIYGEPNDNEAHMVVGHPWVPKGGVLLGVLAVCKRRKW